MIEILLSVCLISDPNDCKDVRLTDMGEVTPYMCMFKGQVAAARWIEGHPEWKLAKWKCGQMRDFAKL